MKKTQSPEAKPTLGNITALPFWEVMTRTSTASSIPTVSSSSPDLNLYGMHPTTCRPPWSLYRCSCLPCLAAKHPIFLILDLLILLTRFQLRWRDGYGFSLPISIYIGDFNRVKRVKMGLFSEDQHLSFRSAFCFCSFVRLGV